MAAGFGEDRPDQGPIGDDRIEDGRIDDAHDGDSLEGEPRDEALLDDELLDDGADAPRLALADDDDTRLPWLEGDDEDEDDGRGGAGQVILLVALGLLALGAIVGGIWWAMSSRTDEVLVADGSTVAAPAEPYKVAPADPGGKTFAGTGDVSFGVSEGQVRPARLGQESPAPGFTAAPAPAPAPSAAAKPAGATPATPAAAPVTGPGVQVGAYSSQASAEAAWARLSAQHEALKGVRHRVVEGRADIGTVYRLQAVPGDIAAANALCGKLKAAGAACQVKP